MDNLANLTYSVDTKPLERVRTQLKGIQRDAQTATERLTGVGGNRDSSRQLGRASNATTDSLNRTARQARQTGNAVERQMSRVERSSTRALNRTSVASAGLGATLGGLRGVLGAFGLASVVRETGQYGAALAEVSTLTDAATIDMAALSEEALNQSREFGSFPIQNVQAFYQAISAGNTDIDSASAAVRAANNLAVAGVSDVESSIDALTTIMNSYNGTAGTFTDISDSLFTSVRLGKTTIDELAPAIGRVANLASTAGISFDEVSGALAALTSGGIGTNEAVTGLRGLISAIIKPSEEAEKALIALQKEGRGLGLSLGAEGLENGLASFLDELSSATDGNIDTISQFFGGVEALTPVLNLVANDVSKFTDNMAELNDKTGAVDTAVTKITQGSAFQFQRITAALTAGILGLTNSLDSSAAPAFGRFADLITTVTTNIAGTISSIGENATVSRLFNDLGNAAQRLGAFLAPVVPFLDDFAIALVAIGSTAAVVTALGVALGLLTSPIALVAAGAVVLINNVDAINEAFDNLTEYLQNTSFFDIASDIGGFIFEGITSGLGSLVSFFGEWIGRGVDYVRDLLGINSPSTVFMEIGGFILEGLAIGLRAAFGFVTDAMSGVTSLITGAVGFVQDRATQFFDWWNETSLEEKATRITTAAIDTARDVAERFTVFWELPFPEKIATVRTAGIELASTAVDSYFDLLTTVIEPIAPEFVLTGVENAQARVSRFFDEWQNLGLTDAVLNVVADGLDAAQSTVTDLRDAWDNSFIREHTPQIITTGIDGAFDVVQNVIGFWQDWIPDIQELEISVPSFADIREGFNSVTQGIRNFWDGLDFFPLSFDIELPELPSFSGIYDHFKQSGERANEEFAAGQRAGYAVVNQSTEDLTQQVASTLDQNVEVVEEAAEAMWLVIGGGSYAATIRSDAENAAKLVGEAVAQGTAIGIRTNQGLVEASAQDLARLGIIDVVKTELDSQSPSKVFIGIGQDVVDGFSIGLSQNIDPVLAASNALAESGTKVFQDAITELNRQYILLNEGEAALAGYEAAIKKATDEEVRSIIAATERNLALEESADALDKYEAEQNKIAETTLKAQQAYHVARIELIAGSEAARRAELTFEGLTATQVGSRVEAELQAQSYKDQTAALATESEAQVKLVEDAAEAQLRAQEELHGAIFDSLRNADSVRDVFGDLGNFMEDWIKDQVALFATNQITALIGFGQAESGGISDIFGGANGGGGFLSGLANIFSSNGEGGGFLDNLKGIFGGGVAPIQNAVTEASSVTELAPAGAGLSSLIGPATAAIAIGDVVGDLLGLDENVLSRGGIVGTTLFGGSRQQTGSGFQVGFNNGEVQGNNFENFERRRSFFRGTERTTQTSELDSEVAEVIGDYFDNLNTNVISSAEALGVAGADSILDSFSVATRQFSGENAKADLAEFLEESTQDAYRLAFSNLAPKLQNIIGTDILDGTIDEIETAFSELGFVTQTIVPSLRELGFQMANTFESAAVEGNALVEALGGTEAATQRLALFQNEFAGSARGSLAALRRNRTELAVWSRDIGLTGGAVINTRAELTSYVQTLDQSTEVGREATATALGYLEAVIAVEDETIRQGEAIRAVTDIQSAFTNQIGDFGTITVRAADAIIEAAGGLDQLQSQTNAFYNNFFTEEERKNIALRDAASLAIAYNDSLGLTGEAQISSAEAFREHTLALFEQAAAGDEAAAASYAQALLVSDAFALITDEGGTLTDTINSLPNEMQTSLESMLTAADSSALMITESSQAILTSIGSANDQLFNFSDGIQNIGEAAAIASNTAQDGIQAWYDSINNAVAVERELDPRFNTLANDFLQFQGGNRTEEDFDGNIDDVIAFLNSRDNGDRDSVNFSELAGIREALERIEQANQEAAIANERGLSGIRTATDTQTTAVNRNTDTQERTGRAIAENRAT